MFNKLKQFKDLRNQAKILQNALSQEFVEYEKNNIKIIMNGNMEITQLTINAEIPKEQLAKILTCAINDIIKRAQKIMAEKIQKMGGIQGFN